MPDDARSPKTKKNPPKEVAKHLAYRNTVRNHMAEEQVPYEARADYRRNLAGTMNDARKSWAEIAAAVGGSEWSARALVSAIAPHWRAYRPRPIPHPLRGGVVMGGEGERP
jgi:hypothetical protein